MDSYLNALDEVFALIASAKQDVLWRSFSKARLPASNVNERMADLWLGLYLQKSWWYLSIAMMN